MVPLILVIAASSLKDLFEDRKRHRQDEAENQRKVFRADPVNAVYQADEWQGLKVGQVIKISRDELVPADLIILKACRNECFVETANLDGETNLKQKQAIQSLQKLNSSTLCRLQGHIICDSPNDLLYRFEGTFSPIGPILQ